MAQAFSTSGAQTAGVLLKTIPKEHQLVIARELIINLRSTFDVASASLAVELVADRDDSALEDELLDVFRTRLEDGSPDQVVSLLASCPKLLGQLVTLAAQHLEHPETYATIELIKVASESTDPDEQTGLGRVEHDEKDTVNSVLLQWLRFAKIAISSGHLLQPENEQRLFTSALKSLNNISRPTALAARDLVFLLISSPAAQQNLEAVQTTIASLIAARDAKLQQTLGYALWMRLLAASDAVDLSQLDLSDDSYWEPLLSGLRNGDAERRKLCLDILKRSVAFAVEQERIGTVARVDTASPRTTSYQYSRYCAVFETLVLARYTNLVVECERDLNLLSSEQSVIQSKWLYVLLSTALDVMTTDQTRKFIGDWILRSDLFSSRFLEGLADFVSHSLLPWAMEGHLFTGSTKLHDGQTLSSRHGDRLSTSVCNLLVQITPNQQPELLDAILDFLVRKHATLFAYSAVHLIRGVSRAFETSSTLTLTKQQVDNLLFISTLRTLPEVATDYLVVQCSKICDLSESRTENSLLGKLSELGQTRFHDLKTASKFVMQNVSSLQSNAIESPAKSQRDVKILASVEKCRTTLKAMAMKESLSSAPLQNVLEDIWSDVEFLEYPRALLVKLPAVFFNTAIYQVAYQDNNEDDTGLRDLLVATLPRLLDLTQRRSFLLAPLVGSLRELVLSAPESASILDLEDCILRICQSPPEPNVDLRMEYSTVPLLSDLLKEPANTCRDHYFGQGEGYGFAAYLDLISRMGSQHPELVQSLLEKLLARWRKQKVPTPTISAWKTTVQLEVMLLCFEQRSPEVDKDVLDSMLKDLYFILSIEPLPRYRYLIEWTLARVQIAHPHLRAKTLDMLSTKDHQSNPKFLASLMKLGVMIATAESGTEDFARSLATIFIALSSSSKIIVRHEAQWAFPQLMDHARAQKWEAVLSNPAHVSLDEYIRSLPRFGDPPAERVMSKIDPIADHTMTNLAEGLWTDLDYTRPPYTTHQDFLDLYANDAALQKPERQPAPCMPLGPPIPKPPRPTTTTDSDSPTTAKSLPPTAQQETEEANIALQTKGTAYLKTSLDPSPQTTSKHPLLLVASLIENPYNLGGLSRVSEIFGARAMYVRDPRITAEKDFTTVAVSSHHHVEIAPLPVAEIPEWVAGKKSEGWTVVGIEQTDRSVLLGTPGAELPAKTILVLGSEREGMPAAVLGECDVLVEIPQVGVTRSLNVQTAAAIVLFEYGRQHGGRKG